MRYQNILIFCAIAVLVLFLAVYANPTKSDKDNLRWHKAWTSPDSGEVEEDIPVPKRGHNSGAWYDFDGDGNLEFVFDDNDQARTFVYENAGDNNYEYRWFTDYRDATGANIYDTSGDRGVVGTDLDADGADELLLIRSTPPKTSENHIPPIRIFKHEAGSPDFLPIDWTVDWDDCPITSADSVLHMEYTNGAGDWDKDGRGEFGVNYKNDPTHYFAIVEVIPPLVPGQVQFRIEHMIDKKTTQNVGLIRGTNLDNDEYEELFLPQRNDVEQVMYYLDCTGPNAWTEYYWGPTDTRVIPDSVRLAAEAYTFIDLDKDGTKEMVAVMQGIGKLDPWAKNQNSLWVAKIDPLNPANMFAQDRWYRLNTLEEMIGLEPTKYTTGASELVSGDVDDDDLADVYFMLGETALPSRIMDAEFVGMKHYSDPKQWRYYTIIEAPKDAGLADLTMPIRGTKMVLADGDKDGKADIYHNNYRGNSASVRPGAYVWEYEPSNVTITDNDNLQWHKAWTSPDSGEVEEDIPVPKRGHNSGAWYDFDGDGNLEFVFDDNDQARTFVYENAGDNNYEYRWFTDYRDATGANIYDTSGDRGVVGTDLDADGADELLLIRSTPPKTSENHIPPIRIFKHEAGSPDFLPIDWTVDWDDCPITSADSVLHMEYTNGAGDWDKDGRGEFGVNYKNDPTHYFAIVEVIPPLVPGQVQFRIEHMIDKKTTQNVGLIRGTNLDNDEYEELFLPQRNDVEQVMYYLDCTGPNAWTEYYWGPTDTRVIPDSVRLAAEAYTFIDLDKDGTKEMVAVMQGIGKLDPWAKNQNSLWVAKIDPLNPANMFAQDRWYRLNTLEEMIGLEPTKYTTGASELVSGDVDDDDLADVYFMLGETALPSRIMDAEFVGTDYTNPGQWNYYTIIEAPKDAGLADLTMPIRGTKMVLADADKDGKADIYHNNYRGNSASIRPGAYVWEFAVATLPVGVDPRSNDDGKAPNAFGLLQNYPNPFNPTTTISFTVPKAGKVLLDVYDVRGRLVTRLLDGNKPAGTHQVVWDGTDMNGNSVASGVYFYSVSSNADRSIRKMMLIK
jgi:hypothetical protein